MSDLAVESRRQHGPFPWRFRFSLRALMAAVVGFACIFAVWRAYLTPLLRESAVIHEIQQSGNQVGCEPRGQYLLRQFIGDEISQRAIGVLLIHGDVPDDALANLASLEHLEGVCIRSKNVGDRGLAHLKSLKQLKSLHLIGTRVTTLGVEDLKRSLPNLIVTSVRER